MAYLSVPSPGKWISDLFGKNILRHVFDDFLEHHFAKKRNSEGSSEGVTQIKKGSYIDPLVMRFSLKSDFLIGNFHHIFNFLVKPYFLFLQYRKSVLKKTQISGPLFEPCSSCVAVDSFFSEKTFSGKQRPPKGLFLGIFCPSVPMSFFFCGRGTPDDVTTQQIWDYLAPLPSHPGTEYLERDALT